MKTKIGFLIRFLASITFTPFLRNPQFIPGISACIITKNDLWLIESIESIIDNVDEIVIVDSSTENFLSRNRKFVDDISKKQQVIYRVTDLTQLEARKLAYSVAKHKWILIWDGDVIALDQGNNDFRKLTDEVRKLDTSKAYYEIYFPQLLIGENFKQVQENEYHLEHWIFSNFKRMKWTPRRWDEPKIPIYFRKKVFNNVYALHLNRLRTDDMEIDREIRIDWYRKRLENDQISFKEYKESKMPGFLIRDSWKPKVKSYNKTTHPDIPNLLKKYEEMDFDEIINSKLEEIESSNFA